MTEWLGYHITTVDSFYEIQEPIVKIAFLDEETLEESYEFFRKKFGDKIELSLQLVDSNRHHSDQHHTVPRMQ